MYYPYFRGRQEEMMALISLPDEVIKSNLILPIIKPFSKSSIFTNRCIRLSQKGCSFGFIVNSDEGEIKGTNYFLNEFSKIFDGFEGVIIPSFEIGPKTIIQDIHAFLAKFKEGKVVLIHRNHVLPVPELSDLFSKLKTLPIQIFLDKGTASTLHFTLPADKRVLLRDGFKKHTPNAEYPPEQHFDDLLHTYKKDGYDGFGDFSIVGDLVKIGGAAAKNVALHLTTDSDQKTALVTHHFVSTTPQTTTNPEKKFFNALTQLLRFTGNPPVKPFNTSGVNGFVSCNHSMRYPGLGCPKRWSIMHHIEFIEKKLKK